MDCRLLAATVAQEQSIAIAHSGMGYFARKKYSPTGKVSKVFRSYYLIETTASITLRRGETEKILITQILDSATRKMVIVPQALELEMQEIPNNCVVVDVDLASTDIWDECKNNAMSYMFSRFRVYPHCTFSEPLKIFRCFYNVELSSGKKIRKIYLPADNYSIGLHR